MTSISSITQRPFVTQMDSAQSTPDRTSGVALKVLKGVGAFLALGGAAALFFCASAALFNPVAGIILGIALVVLGIGLLATINGRGVYVAPPVVSNPVVLQKGPVYVPSPVIIPRPVEHPASVMVARYAAPPPPVRPGFATPTGHATVGGGHAPHMHA